MPDKELEIKIRARVDADGMTRIERALKRIREETREYKDDQTRLNRVLWNAEKVFKETRNKTIALKKEFKEIRQTADPEAKEALKKLSKQIGKAEERERDAIKATREVIQALNDLGVESDEEKAKLKELNQELWKAESFLKGMNPAARKSAKALQGMKKELKETAKQGRDANKHLSGIEKSLNGVFDSMKRGARERVGELLVEGPLQLIEELGERTIQFFRDSNEAYIEFDRNIRQSFTLIATAPAGVKSALAEQIQELGPEIGRTTEETLPALYRALTLGVPEDNVIDYIRNASVAANAANAELVPTLVTGQSILNAYGKDVGELHTVYEQLFFLLKRGSIESMDEINQHMSRVTSVAGEAKVPLEDIVSALIVMTRQGDSFDEATELLSLQLMQLSISGTALGKAFKEAAGKDFRTFIKEGGSLAEAMAILERHAKDTGTSIGEMIGGDSPFYRDQQAARATLELTGKNLQNFLDVTNDANKDLSEMGAAAEEAMGGIAHLDKQVQASSENIKLALGKRLEPTMTRFKEMQIEAYDAITDHINASTNAQAFKRELEELGLTTEQTVAILSAVTREGRGIQTQIKDEDELQRRRAVTLQLIKDGYLETLEPGDQYNAQLQERIALESESVRQSDMQTRRWQETAKAYQRNIDLFEEWTKIYSEPEEIDKAEIAREKHWDNQQRQIEKNTKALFNFNTEFGLSNRFVEAGGKAAAEYYRIHQEESKEAARIAKEVVAVFFESEGLFDQLDAARDELGSVTNELSHEEEVLRIQEANQAIVASYEETALAILEAKAMEDPARLERILAIEIEMGVITEAQARERLEYAHTIVAIQDMTAAVVDNELRAVAAANAIKIASGDYTPYRQAIGAVNQELGAMIKGMNDIDGRSTTSSHTHTTRYQEQGPRPPAGASGATSGTQTGLDRNTPLGLSEGGWIPSWLGTPGRDSVPAMLMPNERVLSHREIRQMGGPQAVDNLARGEGGIKHTTINYYYNNINMTTNVEANGGLHAIAELIRQEHRRQLMNAAKAREVSDALAQRNLGIRRR